MNRAQIGILKQTHQISLTGFLKSQNGSTLKTQVRFEILGDFADQALERSLADEQVRTLLVLSDLTESNGSRTVTMRFLHSSSGRRGFTRGFGRELLAWSLFSKSTDFKKLAILRSSETQRYFPCTTIQGMRYPASQVR